MIEALLTPHGVDSYLGLLHPMLTVHELRAEVTAVHRPSPDAVTLLLRPTRQWQGFRAGQHVRLVVEIDGVRRTRCYSPASSPYRANELELTVKAHQEGLVSRFLYRHAVAGMVVGLSQADGEFTLPRPRPERVLLISGGSGITPVLSMLRTLCAEGYRGDLTFLHYARSEADMPYRTELAELAARHDNVEVRVLEPRTHGYFSRRQLLDAAPWYAEALTYACGPAALLDVVRQLFEAAGLGGRLSTEQFTPPAIVVEEGRATGEVIFSRSGLRVRNSGKTLLEQAEGAGLSPEHGCRMGICFSCTQVKKTGCVRNVLTGDTSSENGEEIQLCISAPAGDVEIDV